MAGTTQVRRGGVIDHSTRVAVREARQVVTTVSGALAYFAGCHLRVAGLWVRPEPVGVHATVLLVATSEGVTVELTGEGTAATADFAAAEAAVAAVRRTDPLAVLVWALAAQGVVRALVAGDGSGERPAVGRDRDIATLHRLLETVPTGTCLSARTRSHQYRALRTGTRWVALVAPDDPGALAVVDDWLRTAAEADSERTQP